MHNIFLSYISCILINLCYFLSCYILTIAPVSHLNKAIQDEVKVFFSVCRFFSNNSQKDDDIGLKIWDEMKECILICLAVGDDCPIDEWAINDMSWTLTDGAYTVNRIEIEIVTNRDVPSINILKISYDGNEK